MTKEEFKNIFIKLTNYTIPFGKEKLLEKHLPSGFKKDNIGNYYYEIGNSETLFTSHLDTFSKKYEKVNHVIDEDDPYIISTDGKTILGGDNKLGCTILFGMIENSIPGTYYFFLGEEPILSGGLWGSRNALESNFEYFKKFKRCIAFDRKQYGSIVVRQMGRMCCSKEFASEIASQLKSGGINWDESVGFGYYTDTAVFMDVIPECTNISAGGFNEHYKSEWVDLNYTYNVYKSALKIKWEELPTNRKLEVRFYDEEKETISKDFKKFQQIKIYKEIESMTELVDLSKTRDISKNGERYLTFSKWLQDYDMDITLSDNKIIINGRELSMNQLRRLILTEFREDILEQIKYYIEMKEKKELNKILYTFGFKTIPEIIKFLKTKKRGK